MAANSNQDRHFSILIADDQPQVLEAMRLLLKSQSVVSHGVTTPAALISAVQANNWSCAVIDLNFSRDTTSGDEGVALIKQVRALDSELPIVAMTAWGSIQIAVAAMRNGANDFIEKPWDNTRLLSILRTQISLAQSRRKALHLEAERRLLRQDISEEFIANSGSMQKILEITKQVAGSNASVIILGESGTGKGVVARQLHEWSPRRDRSFIKVNIGGLADSVFESELFGHTRGAFTDAKSDRIGRFELADGGTLFLDEIANISWTLQSKLLRVLEDGEFERIGSSRTMNVDARIISATNADISAEVEQERFRRDLLYRLNTVEIRVPPLRERTDDIIPLARAFLTLCARQTNRVNLSLNPRAERALAQYPWPGNVRELRHVMERAALLSRADVVDTEALWLDANRNQLRIPIMTLDELEQRLIKQVLSEARGNLRTAATTLGITRQALYRRLEKYKLRNYESAT